MTRQWPSDVRVDIDPHADISETVVIRGRGSLVVAAFAVVEDHVLIDLGSSGRGQAVLEARAKVKYGSVLRCYNGRIQIGRHSTLGDYGVIYGHGGVAIGDSVGIGPHCTITSSEHIITSREIPIRYQGERTAPVLIEDDVWIGASVQVLFGVTVGRGGVIGAGSVVTRSTPQFQVCAGVPCRPVKRRTQIARNTECSPS